MDTPEPQEDHDGEGPQDPPVLRRPPQNAVENHEQHTAEDHRDGETLGPVSHPGPEALRRQTVLVLADEPAVVVEGKEKHRRDHAVEGHEEKCLDWFPTRRALHEVSHSPEPPALPK